ncbi:hypothetical protein KUV41_11430 [Halomonas sp. DP8Y7-1]|uniref:hypothetical protein n=1 Tax=Halomonas sp. DP8Y7-1 TaxID=2859078 RepID=UPI001C944F58|nr:hypothetical protein [Halomonas sp. DP8Y7-1]MBY6029968.1 hypothetical protein [Halomonas sp. DP8Y7-1]
MAYESVEDANQQTLETLTELERRARELVNILKGGIDVGQSGTLGDLSLLDTLSASPVGNAATLRSNIGLGTAATAFVGTGANDVPKTSQADARYARLSGANDFDTMPLVGGSPILESDSNSDGFFTRYADGTQYVWGQLPRPPLNGWQGAAGGGFLFASAGNKTLASSFVSPPFVIPASQDGQVGSRSAYVVRAVASNTAIESCWYACPTVTQYSGSSQAEGTFFAIGYWKNT